MLNILMITAVVIAILAYVISRQPNEFRVTRSATIDAPPAAVFEQVNTMANWNAWSPWYKMEPNARYTLDGPASGVGATSSWVGKKTGAGTSTITESRPNEFVRFRLDFLKPMKATNTTEFTFEPQGSQTHVTWTMYGPNNFMGKAFGLFMNCGKMLGTHFEEGLNSLKAVVEPTAEAA